MKLAIIHTTPATIESLKTLAEDVIPGVQVFNILDDSILPQLLANGGDISEVKGRFISYGQAAYQAGADVILSACSSVGELAELLRDEVPIPVVRIDEAMVEQAVGTAETGDGQRVIGVAATMATTLGPTCRFLEAKAARAGKAIRIEPLLVAEAYQRLMAGDREGHDQVLVRALGDLIDKVDVVVLAQASMARVLPKLPEEARSKFLTSPRLGMQQVASVLMQMKDG